MPVPIEQNSHVRCEKSPGACPFFTAAPECGPSYEVGGFSASPNAKTGVPMSRSRSVRSVVGAEFDPALTEEYQAQVVGSLEERTISGTRQLRVNQVSDEGNLQARGSSVIRTLAQRHDSHRFLGAVRAALQMPARHCGVDELGMLEPTLE